MPCQTGAGRDTIASLQSAIKYLVKSKEVMACKQEDIQVFLPGTTVHNFREKTPLRPEEKIPHSTEKEFLFVHARRDYQDLTPEERRLYANPQYDNEPKAKPMARPPATQLKMNKPKGPTAEEKAAAAAKRKAEEQRKKDEEARKRKEAEAEAARKAEENRRQEEAARKAEEDRLKAEAERKAREARLRAEEEARKAAEAARKKAAEGEEARRKAEREKYVPTPMDMSTQKCWYQLEGDMCAYYIRFNGYEKAGDLKEHILATRRTGKNAALLDGIEDLSDLKLVPPGVEKEIGPQETLPSGTTMDNPILVIVKESNGMGRTLTPYS